MSKARDVLRGVEWSAGQFGDDCPECRNRRSQGHKPNCRLAAALAEPGVTDENSAQEEMAITMGDDKPRMCTQCGRKSWAFSLDGAICGMSQPDGSRCPGEMR